ncbi:MAG: cytochrome c [Edaphocola sp.]
MRKTFVCASVLGAALLAVNCSPKVASNTGKATTAVQTKAAASTKFSAAQLEQGHALYSSNCVRCHKYKEPSDFTASEWTEILKSMIPKARLNEADAQLVTAYVMANSK